ncbi:MAG: DUF512 domain-containing protein [Acidobacteriota bacterium]|jgi:putative radical SAM enzyme (TIGR03279 family)|nr:DUF512 domain-containing protein [Acidobacteriota bacterium]
MPDAGIEILEVAPGSVADRLGIAPGDRLLAVGDCEIPDELALRFRLATADGRVALRILRKGGRLRRFKIDCDDLDGGGGLGVTVAEFPTRRCGNACMFCFVDQLPPGVRPGLRVKDDDYRLSFLYGNYVTLTNATAKDLARIVAERLSPLYVSVHATDPDLRARILGRGGKGPDDLAGKLARLVGGGVRVHAQVVLMPGVNDGAALEKTVFDLHRLGVESVAVVPVGISDHVPPGRGLRPATPSFSRTLLRRVNGWRRRFAAESGRAFVFPADEFFLLAGAPIPGRDYYEDFAQIEDGVGMVRTFLDDFAAGAARRRAPMAGLRGTLVTGPLFFPVLERVIGDWNGRTGASLQVLAVENRFLGRRITVAGLLAGGDVVRALKPLAVAPPDARSKTVAGGKPFGDFIVLPGEALSFGDKALLDDMTLRDLRRELGVPVYSGGRSAGGLLGLLARLRRKKPA